GEHRCLGEWLGRQVVKTASQRLFTRIEGFELEPDFEIELKGFEFRGPLELNCVWGKHV
ncbi:MAG: unspecific monooxygenase, partial [Dehalococcoidia bacterium]|nr:unspecific monooxygenase [Dehalococcoidia bacterium]